MPEFTDHGIIHTNNVLHNICNLIREYPIPEKFTEDERFLLVLAAITHDIGCIVDRDTHEEKSIKMLQSNHFRFLLATIGALNFRALIKIIKWHRKTQDLETIGQDPCDEIRLKLIASIFRLADACDMSGSRIKCLVMDILIEERQLPAKSEAIWKAHLQVEKIKISRNKIQPQVYNLKLADYCLTELAQELEPINQVLTKLGLPQFTLEPVVVDSAIT
ncbi:MAG: HD domain-containing protein [Nitrososphaerota archaeon]|jgi:metal-dependent HD superfamily phosphatase/phosphodiesterase|nr:HD domain-containing protein [Nitrososphaerota archaeon]